MPPRVRGAGDAGVLIELDARVAPDVNAAAIAIAAALGERAVPGVRDIVPTYRSVAVHLDPLRTTAAVLQEAIEGACGATPAIVRGARMEVPVAYGGAVGPDLPALAAGAGMSPDAVIACHTRTDYRVYMLGFLPGFPYLGLVDPRIAAARHARPRPRVATGSVGIAGRQTGIYPQASPGGWQIIGRTPLRMFDPARRPASLLRPGDVVRFTAENAAEDATGAPEDPGPAAIEPGAEGARWITVLGAGLLTTVQDAGRWGHQASGVPVGGALDLVSHRVANAIVGNDRDAAGLEVTLAGPELRLEARTTIAVAGADLEATIDGRAVPLHTAVRCRPGGVLRFGARRTGARAYVAFDGGIAVPPVLGSRSTHVLSRLGDPGRPLRTGDRLPLGPARDAPPRRPSGLPPLTQERGRPVRVLPGPQADEEFFEADVMEQLQRARFVVAPQSDRMGYRLTGARFARHADREMISDATFTGAIQVPPSGEPILLMADRQTTGGYPQAAIVIAADLPRVAQLAPGDTLVFEPCTRAEAIGALVAQEGRVLALG